MKNDELGEKISSLIDKYFTNYTEKINSNSNSFLIRKALENRIGCYIRKSMVNEILIKKGFLFKKFNNHEYCFNISARDISILAKSRDILDKLNQQTNCSFAEYTSLPKYRSFKNFKYTFIYWIRIKTDRSYSVYMVYQVLAKETGINCMELKEDIELPNDKSLEMKPELYRKLKGIFNIKEEECITSNILDLA